MSLNVSTSSRFAWMLRYIWSAVALGALFVESVLAQITPADTVGTNYPGWQSADKVAPRISVDVSFDSLRGLWIYRYTVANDTSARQAISSIDFGVDPLAAPSDPLTASGPQGWKGWVFPYSVDTYRSGVTFFARFADDSLGPESGPPPARINPGDSLSGFVVTSPFPPGYARSYVQGYVQVPPLDDAGDVYPPADTTNSQRGITIFPNQLLLASTASLDGSKATGVVGLLDAAVPAPAGKVLQGVKPRGAVPVAIRLAPRGGHIDRRTFRATLNGVDVSRAFHGARRGGVDLAAVFVLGKSPLVAGENRLVARVEGDAPGGRRRVTDTAELRFTVGR